MALGATQLCVLFFKVFFWKIRHTYFKVCPHTSIEPKYVVSSMNKKFSVHRFIWSYRSKKNTGKKINKSTFRSFKKSGTYKAKDTLKPLLSLICIVPEVQSIIFFSNVHFIYSTSIVENTILTLACTLYNISVVKNVETWKRQYFYTTKIWTKIHLPGKDRINIPPKKPHLLNKHH